MPAKKKSTTVKPTAKKRTLNRTSAKKEAPRKAIGAPFNEHDVQHRLGNFTGAGEHARMGGRNGIVGETKQNFRTEKKRKSSEKE